MINQHGNKVLENVIEAMECAHVQFFLQSYLFIR